MRIKLFASVLILFTFIGGSLFSQRTDTTFSAKLNCDGEVHKIYVKYHENKKNYELSYFILKIDDIQIVDSIGCEYFEVKLIDLNKDDNFDEIILTKCEEAEAEASLFRFDGKNLVRLGDLFTSDVFTAKGDGKILASGWTGFWTYDFHYEYDEQQKKIIEVYKDIYDVQEYLLKNDLSDKITAKGEFKVLSEKKDGAAEKFKVKKGDVLKILKADIREWCIGDDVWYGACNWYYLENSKGEKGWIRLKDFYEIVDGIMWAG